MPSVTLVAGEQCEGGSLELGDGSKSVPAALPTFWAVRKKSAWLFEDAGGEEDHGKNVEQLLSALEGGK